MKITATFVNPNYVTHSEDFDSIVDLKREMDRRVNDPYYPTWEDTEVTVTRKDSEEVTHEGRFKWYRNWGYEMVIRKVG